MILPGRGGEGDAALAAGPGVGEMGHEERLTGEGALAHGEELAHEALVRIRPVAHLRDEGDVLLHVVHRPGLGDDGLAGIEFDFDELHVVAEDLVVDLVRPDAARRHGGGPPAGIAGGVMPVWLKICGSTSPAAAQLAMPLVQTRVGGDGAVAREGGEVRLAGLKLLVVRGRVVPGFMVVSVRRDGRSESGPGQSGSATISRWQDSRRPNFTFSSEDRVR